MSTWTGGLAFSHTAVTTASRSEIWRLWVDPESWSRWDLGLRSASTLGATLSGNATGEIVSLSGKRAHFRVTEWAEGMAYAFETELPLARLNIRRSFEPGRATRFTHAVRFSGPFAGLWALVLGRGFRRALPPTMVRLAWLAEGREP